MSLLRILLVAGVVIFLDRSRKVSCTGRAGHQSHLHDQARLVRELDHYEKLQSSVRPALNLHNLPLKNGQLDAIGVGVILVGARNKPCSPPRDDLEAECPT